MTASIKRAPRALPETRIPEVVDGFRSVFATVKSRLEEGREKTGLAASQLWAMTVIEREDGISVGDLASALSIHQSTASNLLRPLLDQGLVEAPRVEEDRRSVRLGVTPAGKRMLRRAPGPFDGLLRDALGTLDYTTLARLEHDLGKVAAALE
ncbi:MAG: MarR family transcriptional regulator, partial [Sphingomonadales bacterium]